MQSLNSKNYGTGEKKEKQNDNFNDKWLPHSI